MAEGDGYIYNSFKKYVMDGVFDLDGAAALQVTLHTGYSPDIDSHTIWGDTGVSSTEITGTGYVADGKVLASPATTQDNTNDRGKFDANDLTWTSLTLSPATPSHLILWDNTPTTPVDPLIAYWILGTTATNGGDYTIQWGSNGILLVT